MRYIKPDYKNGSIINLMSSIIHHYKGKSKYRPLNLKFKKNVLLITIDGLGYNYLMRNGGFLRKHCKRSITSTFPSTTGCAAMGLQKGVPPQQHGISGWYINSKEAGGVIRPLVFNFRAGGGSLKELGFKEDSVTEESDVFDKIKTKSIWVAPKNIVGKSSTKGKKKKLGYNSLNGFFRQLKKATNVKGKKYIYGYWDYFDYCAHKKGIKNEETLEHLKELEEKIENLSKSLKDTTLLVTADHGLVDKGKEINLKKDKKLYECLSHPLSGEPRYIYCYVLNSKEKQFLREVKKYKENFFVHKSEDLVKNNYYGLGKVNPKLMERIGDYVLIMKNNNVAFDNLDNDDFDLPIGLHGGLTDEEMLVPLVKIE